MERSGSAELDEHSQEDDTSESWRTHKKHFFILSNAGKPIYSRYGDEHKLAGFAAILQAIMSFVENSGDVIRVIRAGKHQVVFLVKGPLYLVSISATDEPASALEGQLELLHGQVMMILTSAVDRCLLKNPKFDMKPLLGGTENCFSLLVHSFSWDFATFLHAYTCLWMPHSSRKAATAAIEDLYDGLLYGLLLCGPKVVTLFNARKTILHPDDILLLTSFISSSDSFRSSESFTPVCLPHHNKDAFLYAYVAYLEADICLILVTAYSDAFYQLKEARLRIERDLRNSGVIQDIVQSYGRGSVRAEDIPYPVPSFRDAFYSGLSSPAFASTSSFASSSAAFGATLATGLAGSNDTAPSNNVRHMEANNARQVEANNARQVAPNDARQVEANNAKQVASNEADEPVRLEQTALSALGGPGGLWHFLYRSRFLDQYVSSEFSPPLTTREARKSLFRSYQRVYVSMQGGGGMSSGTKMECRRTEQHFLLAWRTSDFELFAMFDPLAEKEYAVAVCNRICIWVRENECDVFLVSNNGPMTW